MPFLFLKNDLEKLKVKREEVNRKYRAAGQEVGEATSQGGETFHDNSPYEIAMNEMHIQAQMLQTIDSVLRDIHVVVKPGSSDMVSIGHKVRVRDAVTSQDVWYFLGSYIINGNDVNVDADEGTAEKPYNVTYMSPIGAKLNGKRLNQTFDLKLGSRPAKTFEIVEII